ncbi:nucleotidyltransferase domain-containing protein [Caldibacillus lycopersici]|uniref:Nucleotidyltransferase domain-containing protein n=1 Tax=Perspicuibacillus lycopersici TaxID=1325689 RepID=A0AAE3LTY3_9BACI|nr:nucleotidyltransferase domain-containing protein [Perspicuibacillus lycopersici]MCU9614728.1 nucleotidyltransferase domain-containing protein [Perspicuibacillus lycopersici]
MEKSNRFEPIEAAKQFVDSHFPNCQGAILAGSVVRGEATDKSDLDIVIFDQQFPTSYRESFIEFGWAIEAFVHNKMSYKQYFENDYKRARPSLPNMVAEGIILKDEGIITNIKREADELLANGPEKWTLHTIMLKRYFITDALDDFIGCSNRAEELFIANQLAELVSEFVLRTNQQWIGTSKWTVRALKHYDPLFAAHFVQVFDTYYTDRKKNEIITFVQDVLKPYGGTLFAGFSLGKSNSN